MREKLKVRQTYVNNMSGLRTLELSDRAWKVVRGWYESQGIEPSGETIRGFRVNAKGRVTFKAGVGYAVFDSDLLGGDGSGDAQNRFEDDTDAYLWIV